MFVCGGSFILSSRTRSFRRPHQRSRAAAVLEKKKKETWIYLFKFLFVIRMRPPPTWSKLNEIKTIEIKLKNIIRSHESGYDIRGWPAEYETGFRGFASLRYILYVTRSKPNLAHLHCLLQFETSIASSFRDQQEIGKEKEVPFLRLHALKFTASFAM